MPELLPTSEVHGLRCHDDSDDDASASEPDEDDASVSSADVSSVASDSD
jgi:hypothetical protein